MAYAPMAVDVERFRGLTRGGIRALLDVDTRALKVDRLVESDDCDGVDTIAAQYAELGVPFSVATMLRYAELAEVHAPYRVAAVWYEAHARANHERTHLRAFLIRSGDLVRARTWFLDLTPRELRKIGNEKLNVGDVRAALDAYIACAHRPGLQRVLRRALQCDDAIARRAAKALGRSLTDRERVIIVRRGIRMGGRTEVFRYIRKHQLTPLFRPFIAAMTRDISVPIRQVSAWARKLGITPARCDLKRRLTMLRAHWCGPHHREAVAVAELLAEGSRRRQERIRLEIYTWARAAALEEGDVKSAERYGQRIGKPLTLAECIHVVVGLRDVREDVRRFCCNRAVARIAEAVGAPQVKPTGTVEVPDA